MNYKTETVCDNLKIKNKTEQERELHSVLTYQTESKRLGCINRDVNAVNNYEKIITYWLEHKKRPVNYERKWPVTHLEKNVSNTGKPKQVHLLLDHKEKAKNKGSKIIVKGKKETSSQKYLIYD